MQRCSCLEGHSTQVWEPAIFGRWAVRLPEWARTAALTAQSAPLLGRSKVTDFSPGRPPPEQVTVYFCAACPWSVTVVEPDVPSVPDQAPLAVQELAFWLDQVRVALCPGITALGLMEIEATEFAAGGAIGTELPPLHPERTKAERTRSKQNREKGFPVFVGNCIRPPCL